MGNTYSAPRPESTAQVLQSYSNYLPQLIGSTSGALPSAAQNQLDATIGTQPLYNALNLQQAQQFSLPLAQVGQDVQRSNALAGAGTNLTQLQNYGTDIGRAADATARAANPGYYSVQDAANKKATDLLGAVNLTGLSPGEFNSTERANNQSNQGTGNAGLNNNTNTIGNAMNFGGAFNSKLGLASNAINTANQTATSAQNTGFNPVSLTLGQPNASTMSNFGTGTFTNTNAKSGDSNASNVFGFGNSLLGGVTGMNNAATTGAYGLAGANSIPSYLGAMPSYS